ncbi:GNAT family N-acetyltransferase [Auraticoccus monumenti]|uniref:Predicted acetyltransferase n=1 Tax=Auraticoccus monumenti TaxID=675864 RepID=A0A1G7A7E0_9ACTN|nr:GNAT family N-acetyltransferase [Auraticoccus monumenti]SDE10732.1 Predicted acetyltransferase [Auraticoccus monumenti]
MTTETRQLTSEDLRALHALGHEAFGIPRLAEDAEPDPLRPGHRVVGVVEDGRVLAAASGIDHRSYWHRTEVPSLGIGGVSVAVEHRGSGLLAGLLTDVHDTARSAGVALATLYPSAPGIYRGLGYEVVGHVLTLAVPTAVLAQVRVPDGVRLRRAELADVPAVRDLYRRWAAGYNGPLTRTGPAFPATDAELLAAPSGTTLVERDGELIGSCSFDRGHEVSPRAAIGVRDLVALEPDGYLALLASLGSSASVVGRVEIHTSGDDVVRLLTRSSDWEVVDRAPYMLAVLDVAGACTQRRWPQLAVRLDLTVADRDGEQGWSLELDGSGSATCEPAPVRPGAPVLTRRGLAARYAGSWSCHALRQAGLLHGDAGSDPLLDALFTGDFHVRDHF